jgi:hypothetical protein
VVQIYVAGVCNIGPEEIARRRTTGWVGLSISVVLVAILMYLGVNPAWRLFVFLPASLSATGFLQAYFGFCTGFARRGIFNFGARGQTQQVPDDASKQKDRKQGNRITLYSVLIGVVVALVCFLI